MAGPLKASARLLGKKAETGGVKQAFIRAFLGNATRNQSAQWNRIFRRAVLPLITRNGVLERIRRHQREGARVFIVSASPDLYLEPIVTLWGFDGLISTRLEWKDDRLTGRIIGKNCKGAEKARRIKEVFTPDQLEGSHAYGDSPADRWMMELASFAHYV